MRSATVRMVAAVGMATLAWGGLMAAPSAERVTAGDLAVRLARAAGVDLPARGAEKAAANFLAARGVMLGDALDATLIEADLVQAARVLGATVSSDRPSSPVTPAQGTAFIGAVLGTLSIEGQKEGDINASCQGRDSRASRKGTPASPANPNATAPPCGGGEPQP